MGSCCKPTTRAVSVQTEPKILKTVATNYEIRQATPAAKSIRKAQTPVTAAPRYICPYVQCGVSEDDPLKLIDGYEKEALLPLENALQVFYGHIDNLQEQIQEAKADCHYPTRHGLSRDQSAAIYIYSMRNNDHCLYNSLQQAWKSNDRSQMQPWFKYLRLLLSGLTKLPDVKTEIWQGIVYNEDADEMLQLDSLPLYTYLGSCASSMKEVHEALEHEQPKSQKILLEYSADGKDISDYTPNGRKEMMILPGLKVNKSKKNFYDQNGSFCLHLTQERFKSLASTPLPSKTKTPIPMNIPTPIPKSIFKHFLCPAKHCQHACPGDHEANHCHGFFHLKHHCSHHCVRVNTCSNPQCKNRTLIPNKPHKESSNLHQCNKCEGIFCEDCCFK